MIIYHDCTDSMILSIMSYICIMFVSDSANKTDRCDTTEILLKVALNTINDKLYSTEALLVNAY